MRGAAVILLFVGASAAHAGGRYCERRTDLCWDCADIQFPAEIPCTDPSGCSGGELCVNQSDVPTCFTPTEYCCASAPCETAPGCSGSASSCGDVEPDGRFDHCTFLSDCPPPPDGGPPDAPLPDAPLPDAPPSDGPADARPPSADARVSDARVDARPPADAAAPPSEDEGCDCEVGRRRSRRGGPLLLLVLLAIYGIVQSTAAASRSR